MIDYGGDGYRQHFRALVYYADYLRDFFHNLSLGKFRLPQWDFSIGEGNDILSTFHYYCIGDVFTFFAFLVPDRYMYLYYDGISFARMYFAGIAFSSLCFYKGKKNVLIVLATSLLYAFNPLNLANMAAHVFFLSASVYLPLIILGVEKIINKDKPYTLILSVMLSSLSNIYFFYMNVVSTVVYTLIRVLFETFDLREKVMTVLRIALYSFYGVLMSAVIFLPSAYSMLMSSRFDGKILWDPLYKLNDYLQMFTGLSFGGYLYFGGFTVLGIFSIILLLLKRKNKTLLVLFGLCVLFACIPLFGTFYNAMVYPTTRWMYAVSLYVNYLIADTFEDLKVEKKEKIVLLLSSSIYYMLCVGLDRNRWQIHAMFLIASLSLSVLLLLFENKRLIYVYCLLLSVFSLSFDILYSYSPKFWDRSANGTPIEIARNIKQFDDEYLEKIDKDGFYRFSGDLLDTNASIHGNGSSTQYYWSIANENVIKFRKDLGLSDHNNHHFDDYDDRFALNELAGIKYYIKKKAGTEPFGFDLKDKNDQREMYENRYNLPLIYAYDGYLEDDDWYKFDIAQRNESLLQAAVVDEAISGYKEAELEFLSVDLLYELNGSTGVDLSDHLLKIKENGSEVRISSTNKGSGEYYLLIEGLDSDVSSNILVSCGKTQKYLFYKSRYHSAYPDKHNFMINLGHLESLNEPVVVTFPNQGVFTYSDIKVVYQPLTKQLAYAERLGDISISRLEIDDGHVEAQFSLDHDKIVCFAIPYARGWSAYVDGEKADVLRCNIQYMCIPMSRGSHEVSLNYSTPMLKQGAIVSVVTMLGFLFIWFKNEKFKNVKQVN